MLAVVPQRDKDRLDFLQVVVGIPDDAVVHGVAHLEFRYSPQPTGTRVSTHSQDQIPRLPSGPRDHFTRWCVERT